MVADPNTWNAALALVERHIQNLVLFDPKHQVAIVLVGCKDTDNESDYEGVVESHRLEVPSIEMLRKIRNLDPNIGGHRADVIGGVMTAFGPLMGVQGQRKVLVVTDGQTMPEDEDDDMELVEGTVVGFVQTNAMQVEVVGIDRSGSLTQAQRQNISLLQKLTPDNDNSIVSMATHMAQLSKPAVKPVSQVSKFRGQLIFGDAAKCGAEVNVNLWAFSLGVEKKFPSATKIIGRSKYESEVGTKAVMDREYVYKHPEIGTDEETERFEREELSRAYTYGREAVPFTEFDEANLKLDPGPKSMVVLAQVPAAQVERHLFMSPPDVLVPAVSDAKAAEAVAAISIAMRRNATALIVKWVVKSNSAQKLHALLPHRLPPSQLIQDVPADSYVDCFISHSLPFMEDARHLVFPKPFPEPSAEQQSAVRDVVDALSMPDSDYSPSDTWNPALHFYHTAVAGKAIASKSALVETPALIERMVGRKRSRFDRAAPALARFKAAFPLEKVPDPKLTKRAAFMDENEDEEVKAAVEAAKKAKLEDGAMTVASLKPKIETDALKIRAGDPVGDFVEMISRTDHDLWDKAVLQLSDMICKLVRDSVKDMNYTKALTCFTCLRANAIKFDKPLSFNSALQDAKSEFEFDHRRKGFWEQVAGSGTNLISTAEHPMSTVSVSEAEAFLKPPEIKLSAAAPEVAPVETDDLLDELE